MNDDQRELVRDRARDYIDELTARQEAFEAMMKDVRWGSMRKRADELRKRAYDLACDLGNTLYEVRDAALWDEEVRR